MFVISIIFSSSFWGGTASLASSEETPLSSTYVKYHNEILSKYWTDGVDTSDGGDKKPEFVVILTIKYSELLY